MLKKTYKFFHKIKFYLMKDRYKSVPLNDSKISREFLEKNYKKKNKETNFRENFLFKPTLDLSIIIPIYNSEIYLESCIESCIQKTSFSYEIILIDDGSCDASANICDKYAQKYNFINTFHIKNSGVSYARNFGIRNSKGRFLMFVDSDDYVSENAIQTLLEKSTNAEIVQGMYKKIKRNKVFYKSKKITPNNLGDFSKEYGYVWGKIYKREIFANIKFPLGFWFEDMINDLVIYPQYKSINFVNKYIYNYTLNPKSITSTSKNSLKILDSYFVLEKIIKNFDVFNITFTQIHFKRFLFQASFQIFVRLRRYNIIYMKNIFVLLSDLTRFLIEKYKIETSPLSKIDKELVDALINKKFSKWKDLSAFYH